MRDVTRRAVLQQSVFSLATLLSVDATRRFAFGQSDRRAKFIMSLRCHSIGIQADQMKAIRLAHKHGFDAVVPDASFLAELSDDLRARLLEDMRDKQLVWGAAGLPVSLGGDDGEVRRGTYATASFGCRATEVRSEEYGDGDRVVKFTAHLSG